MPRDLVLLDERGRVLQANDAARRINHERPVWRSRAAAFVRFGELPKGPSTPDGPDDLISSTSAIASTPSNSEAKDRSLLTGASSGDHLLLTRLFDEG